VVVQQSAYVTQGNLPIGAEVAALPPSASSMMVNGTQFLPERADLGQQSLLRIEWGVLRSEADALMRGSRQASEYATDRTTRLDEQACVSGCQAAWNRRIRCGFAATE